MNSPFRPEAPRLSPINAKLGIQVDDLDDGAVRLCMDTDPGWHNEVGLVHGGLAALLMDGAMGRAVGRSLGPEEVCATMQLSIQYLAPAEGRLEAIGRATRRGRGTAFMQAECRRADGRLVALAHGVWAIRSTRP